MKQEDSKRNSKGSRTASNLTSTSFMKTPHQSPTTRATALNILRNKSYLQIPKVLALATTLALTQLAGAAPIWNNVAGGNWSVDSNWSPSGAPGSASDVIFGNTGAGSPNTNDISSETINSLTYDWSNGSQQSTVIKPGTLTVNGAGIAGTALILAGSAAAAPAAGTLAPAAITGAGGNLVLSGLGDLVVHLGQGTAGGHLATLDMSGLAACWSDKQTPAQPSTVPPAR
jgi:hypothetical protein